MLEGEAVEVGEVVGEVVGRWVGDREVQWETGEEGEN